MLILQLLVPASAGAWHKRTPAVVQITTADAGALAHPNWAGYRYVFFDSDADLLGTGSEGRQAFVFDLQERAKTGLPALQQLTGGPGDSQRPSSGVRGKLVVFDALTGGAGPRQLFLLDRRSGSTSALTRGTGDSLNGRMDDGSRVIVFESKADFFGTGVTGTQVYLVNLKLTDSACPYPCPANGNLGLTQITNKSGNSRNVMTSKGGKTVVFESDADLLGSGETETQIYRVDVRTGVITAFSHGPGASRSPTMSSKGGEIAFESEADLSGAGTGGTQIFLYTHLKKEPVLRQVTFAPGGNSVQPTIERNGKGLAFISTDDLLGTGSSGPEIFTYDVIRATTSQITSVPGISANPAYSAGVFTAFLSDGDLLNSGSTGLELYVVNLFALGGRTLP